MAASNPRIVSSGRSRRFRVGLERSGSAKSKSARSPYSSRHPHVSNQRTDELSLAILVLYAPKGEGVSGSGLCVDGHCGWRVSGYNPR